MRFELFVALRYLRDGRSQTILILAGVSVGVGVMVFLSALMNGLQASLIRQTLSSQAHVVIKPRERLPRPLEVAPPAGPATLRVLKSGRRLQSIEQWQPLVAGLERMPNVTAVSPEATGSAFATSGQVSQAVALRGVDPVRFDRIVDVSGRLRAGTFRPVGAQAVIGAELAGNLGVGVGDKVRLSAGSGEGDAFTVTGVFDLGNKDVNERWVLVSLRTAQTLLELPGGVSVVQLQVTDIFDADEVAGEIATWTGLQADSWMKINRQLMVGLRSQDSSKLMIQFFVIIAVALGIASVLVVSVVQRSREIGILKAVGTRTATITRIFLLQGGILGLAGSALGSAFGAGLALLFANLAKSPDGSPVFPVALEPRLFAQAALIATATGLLAAVVPGRRAARLDPAQAIHHV